MRYMGIDYGQKKTGIAVSDEGGMMAYPLTILDTTHQLADRIVTLAEKENIAMIVFGLSVTGKGKENPVMQEIHELIGQVSLLTHIPVELQSEFGTSHTASQLDNFAGFERRRPANMRGRQKKEKRLDDSAAAIMLQRFLDKQKKV